MELINGAFSLLVVKDISLPPGVGRVKRMRSSDLFLRSAFFEILKALLVAPPWFDRLAGYTAPGEQDESEEIPHNHSSFLGGHLLHSQLKKIMRPIAAKAAAIFKTSMGPPRTNFSPTISLELDIVKTSKVVQYLASLTLRVLKILY